MKCFGLQFNIHAIEALADDARGTIDSPSVRLQVNILQQLAPILQVRPLQRLLELHDVRYVESDKAKELRPPNRYRQARELFEFSS